MYVYVNVNIKCYSFYEMTLSFMKTVNIINLPQQNMCTKKNSEFL